MNRSMGRGASILLGLALGIGAGALVGLPTYQAGVGAVLGAVVGLAAGAKWKRPADILAGATAGVVLGWLIAKSIYGVAPYVFPEDLPRAISIPIGLFFLASPLIGAALGVASALLLPQAVRGKLPRGIGAALASGLVTAALFLLWPQAYADACSEKARAKYLEGVSTDGSFVFIAQVPDHFDREVSDRELARGESYSLSDGLASVRYEVKAIGSRGAHVLLTSGHELAVSRCIARIPTEPDPAAGLPGLLPPIEASEIAGPTGERTDVLVIRGRIFANPMGSSDPVTVRAELESAVMLPDQPVPHRPTQGEYHLVLRDDAGQELARTPFYAPGAHSREDPFPVFEEQLVFVPGTVLIQIERTEVLASLAIGETAPTLTLISPNGGETLTELPIRVEWQANDPDGDELSIIVEFSLDGGRSWKPAAEGPVKSDHLEIPILNTLDMVTTRGLFRVSASDGVHTATDQSDAEFTIPDPLPLAHIETRFLPETMTPQQTLELSAVVLVRVSDDAVGSVDSDQIEWHSDLDGFLGDGPDLAVQLQRLGRHTVTLRVTDPAGNSAEDTAVVEVVSDFSGRAQVPGTLFVGIDSLYISPRYGQASDVFSIDIVPFGNAIAWSASASDPWIWLSHSSGTTSERITVSYDPSLPAGRYFGTITVRQVDQQEDQVTISVWIDLVED